MNGHSGQGRVSVSRSFTQCLGHTSYRSPAIKDYDRTDRAHELNLPTLFICGRYDAATPEETTRYHRLVDGSQLVILEQSSHSPFDEERERFMQVVRDFLRRVEVR